jgi:hypothetical protein
VGLPGVEVCPVDFNGGLNAHLALAGRSPPFGNNLADAVWRFLSAHGHVVISQ